MKTFADADHGPIGTHLRALALSYVRSFASKSNMVFRPWVVMVELNMSSIE